MTLDAYLKEHGLSTHAFARLTGLDQAAIHRYRRGERIPRPMSMGIIVQATNGAVTPADFYPPAAATATQAAE